MYDSAHQSYKIELTIYDDFRLPPAHELERWIRYMVESAGKIGCDCSVTAQPRELDTLERVQRTQPRKFKPYNSGVAQR